MTKKSESEKLYTIGEVSKICNIPTKTLRYYDQIGVLSPDVVSKENSYRYYSEKTLIQVAVVKYYKQMGFKLEEMQGFVEGKGSYFIDQHFRHKIEELKNREQEIVMSRIAVSDWYDLLEEARMVRQNDVHDIGIKYLPGATYCWQEQPFDYDYIASIINIEWVNYLDSVENQITGAVILNYPSYKDKMNGLSKTVRIMQKPLRSCKAESNVITLENRMVIAVYHIGGYETLDKEYERIEKWAAERGYECAEECYERYVVDYWTTRNPDEFVTEIIIPVKNRG